MACSNEWRFSSEIGFSLLNGPKDGFPGSLRPGFLRADFVDDMQSSNHKEIVDDALKE